MTNQAEYQTINVGQTLTFRIPPEARSERVQAIDSLVGVIEGDGYQVTYDYGRFGEQLDEYRDYPGYSISKRRYGPRKAKEAVFEDPMDSPDKPYIRLLRIEDKEPNALILRVSCSDEAVCCLADAIFESVEFR